MLTQLNPPIVFPMEVLTGVNLHHSLAEPFALLLLEFPYRIARLQHALRNQFPLLFSPFSFPQEGKACAWALSR